MPEPKTAQEQMNKFVEDHERRLRALEAQEKTIYTPPYVDDDSGLIPWGGVRCQDLIPPLGDFGVCNGQFECGPTAEYPIAMQWVDESVGGTVTRIDGGAAAGNYYLSLAGGTGIATMRHDWYIPVHRERDYYIACHAKGKAGTDVLKFGVHCYNEDKTYLGTAWAYNAAPGAAWVAIERRVGPHGDLPLIVTTRYVRVVAQAPNTGESLYFDDAQFQQMKAAQSSTINLTNTSVQDQGDTIFTLQAYTQYVNSVMNFTVVEPSYAWGSYLWAFKSNNAAARVQVFVPRVSGVNTLAISTSGAPIANYENSISTGMFRSVQVLLPGVHTMALYIYVYAGNTITCRWMSGHMWLVRAY